MNSTTSFSRQTVIIITAILIILFYILFKEITITQPTAKLYLENSTAIVNGKPARDAQPLTQSDVIETKDGTATVVLYDSIIITLQQNTTVTLSNLSKNHPIVKQTGTTWNKFLTVTGIDGFTVHTSTSVASVRGTAFELNDDHLIVGEGEVSYTRDEQTILVQELTIVEKQNNKLIKRALRSDELTRIKKHTQRTINIIERSIAKEQKKVDKLKERLKQIEEKEHTSITEEKNTRTVKQENNKPRIREQDAKTIAYLKKTYRLTDAHLSRIFAAQKAASRVSKRTTTTQSIQTKTTTLEQPRASQNHRGASKNTGGDAGGKK
ncbi:FecR domain-containing protein [Candidatus Woesearchaeota archaeon]|nr:FecR domain-containing protein [Candidatus Woesearchaeota archaeon]